ncbi:MAG: peptidyl-prolyl cis-trans isomerase [Xanthomonadales bacterium]|nr:peptidyl-prolyl cis-trans isomerase [Xanthomonadales bacterium]
MKQLLREPLFHFLLIGALLFTPYYFLQPAGNNTTNSKGIRLSFEEISQQVLLFQSQWNREPTTEELAQLMENRVQEEVLYREALALGLDQGDTIVKRRLAQKMQFLAADTAAAHEPTTEELQLWYQQHTAQFTLPARYSFRHLYFSPDRRGVNAREDAVQALVQLQGQPEDTGVADTAAHAFMFQDYYRERSPEFLGKEFGPTFAMAIEQIKPGSWQGPVESGLGWHLVFVDDLIPGRVAEFEEVITDVKTAWMIEQKARAWEKAYKEMRARYTVLLPAPPDETPGQTPQPAQAPADDSGDVAPL